MGVRNVRREEGAGRVSGGEGVEGVSTPLDTPWVNNIKMILCHGKTKTRY